MVIGGLQKFTLIDFPNKLAATVFLSGCNFRCPWCYSSELVLPENIKKQPKISEKSLFDFLDLRKGSLEGVVICGGEPTINKDLPSFLKKIKKLGYAIKLDTNGSNSAVLANVIKRGLVDYVAMDIKGPKEKYSEIVGKKINIKEIDKSVAFLKQGGIDYEFRTTVVPAFHKKEDILETAKWIFGAEKYYLQSFRPEKTIDPRLEKIKPYPDKYLWDIVSAISPFFKICRLRG
jgi:pyruvate formate lyase activating enzyme